MADRERGTGPFMLGLILRHQDVPAERYTDNLSDRMSLHALPEELLVRLERFCDLSPASAADLIRLAVELVDAGVDIGREEAIIEVEERTPRVQPKSGKASALERKYLT